MNRKPERFKMQSSNFWGQLQRMEVMGIWHSQNDHWHGGTPKDVSKVLATDILKKVGRFKNWWSVPHSTYPYMQARSRNSLYFRGVALVDSHGLCVALVDSQTRCTVQIGYNRYLQTKKGVRSPKQVDLSIIYTLSWAYPFFRSLVGGLFARDTFLNKLGFVSEPLLSILPGSTLKW